MIFAIKVVGGQEINVASHLAKLVKVRNLPINAILTVPKTKGYIYVECDHAHYVIEAIKTIKHARMLIGNISLNELEILVRTEPILEKLKVNGKVEIIAGALKGTRAKVNAIDKVKNEITVELFDIPLTMRLTIPADYVNPIEWKKRMNFEDRIILGIVWLSG